MSIWHKRLIYSFFFLIFFISAPLVILYTAGYRFNSQRQAIQKLGLLMVETQPRDVNVFLDAKLLASKTPARLKNLATGEYFLTLKKDGYWLWETKVKIEPEITIFIKDINLMKKSLPNQLVEASSPVVYGPNRQKMAFAKNNQLQIYNFDNRQSFIAFTPLTGSEIKDVSFSPTGKKVLLTKEAGYKKNFWLVDTEKNLPAVNLNLAAKKNLQLVKWHQTDDNLLILADGQGLWQYDIFNKTSKLIDNRQNISDIYLDQTSIIYTFNLKQRTYFIYKDLLTAWQQNGEVKPNFKIWGKTADKIIFFNQTDSQALIVNLFEPSKSQKINAKKLQWQDDHTILAFNDWEIYFYNLTENKSWLITRYGQAISDIQWLPEQQKLFFVSQGSLRVMQMNDSDGLNSFELLRVNSLNDLELSQNRKTLYFTGQIGQQKGFYTLPLFD